MLEKKNFMISVSDNAFPGCEITFGDPGQNNTNYRVSFDMHNEHL